MPANSSELLTLPEASAMLRLQPSTLRSWVLKRRIVHYKLGSRIFFRRADIEQLIAQSVVPAKDRHAG